MLYFLILLQLLPTVLSAEHVLKPVSTEKQTRFWYDVIRAGQQMYLQHNEVISRRDFIGQFPRQKFIITGPSRVYYRRILTPIYRRVAETKSINTQQPITCCAGNRNANIMHPTTKYFQIPNYKKVSSENTYNYASQASNYQKPRTFVIGYNKGMELIIPEYDYRYYLNSYGNIKQ
uniref:Uncharacterized protein n=1 Tax=Syphacia muris TaxID=451379 RepID=A0A0N5AV38_9BILA